MFLKTSLLSVNKGDTYFIILHLFFHLPLVPLNYKEINVPLKKCVMENVL